jgi:hypothetical protein
MLLNEKFTIGYPGWYPVSSKYVIAHTNMEGIRIRVVFSDTDINMLYFVMLSMSQYCTTVSNVAMRDIFTIVETRIVSQKDDVVFSRFLMCSYLRHFVKKSVYNF